MKEKKPQITVKLIKEGYNIRGDNFYVYVPQCVDQKGNYYSNEYIDDVAVDRALITYRIRHHMLMPVNIRSLNKAFAKKNIDLANLLGINQKSLTLIMYDGLMPSSSVEQKLEKLYDKAALDIYVGKDVNMYHTKKA